MNMRATGAAIALGWMLLASSAAWGQEKNLLTNPSFAEASDKDKAQPLAGWTFRVWEGDGKLRVSPIGHEGKQSALMIGTGAPKMRIFQSTELEPGRYRLTAFIRGFDIGKGTYGASTEIMLDAQEGGKGKYHALGKEGTFGWSKVTLVADIDQKRSVTTSIGTWAPGFFWVADMKLEKVGDDVAVTGKPVIDKEEAPIRPTGKLDGNAIHCPLCGARNMAAWKTCYVCAEDLAAKKVTATTSAPTGPDVRVLANFIDKNPFTVLDTTDPAPVVDFPGGKGVKAMRHDKSYNVMIGDQNWTGYDYLKLDVFTEAKEGMSVMFEFYDAGSVDYWTRAHYNTIVSPDVSTILIPLKQVYQGEKNARPGPALDLRNVKKVAVIIADKPQAPLLVSNVRLERAAATENVQFDGLFAFDFQSDASSPVMDGFVPLFPTNAYSEIKGYGLRDAKTRPQSQPRVYEPDPLYGDYFSIDSGSFVMDLPNGKYHVVLNVNRPPAFWGNLQAYTKRTIQAQSQPIVTETYDEAAKKERFFRYWNQDDLPTDNTFEKYENRYDEKAFDAEVTDGQLVITFGGDGEANCVSSMIVYPVEKAAAGEKFIKWVTAQRQFQFELNHKRTVHRPTGDGLAPTDADQKRGYVTFTRDLMKEVLCNDTPFKAELGKPVSGDAFAGELAPMTLAISPLRDLGKVTASVGDLTCEGGAIPASSVEIGNVSYRLARVSMDGSVYAIQPRYITPSATVEMPKDIVRRFWLTAKVPADAKAGLYKGKLTIKPEKGEASEVPVELRVRAGTLDAMDVPAGPWGYPVPYADNAASLKKMREYGFTTFSSGQVVAYGGFKDGKPVLNFKKADELMATAKEMGFQAVMFYGTLVSGIGAYSQDTAAMTKAGFKDYAEFLKPIYTEIQKHAEETGWLTYFVNLGDEPSGDALIKSAENAEAYRKAFPKGPPYFTAATSVHDMKDEGHLRLAKALSIADLNLHSEESVKAIHDAGGEWAFYNGGNRWTFGDYMYKATKQFGMKFRISWHWNATNGYPYYALDAREDEFAWCNGSPDGTLIPSVSFECQREGLGDYRRLLTLSRLAKDKADTDAGKAAQKLIADRMASFKLGQRDHDALFGADDWAAFRAKVNDAIDALRK